MGGGKTEISLTIEDALLKVTYQLCGVYWCCHHCHHTRSLSVKARFLL